MVAMDLRRMGMLRELSVRGSVTAVATALGYSPSAVSQQLSVLEKEVGHQLLEPAGRGVRLTRAGNVLVGHAEGLLQAAEAAQVDLACLDGRVSGRVRAVGLQSAARRLLIPALVQAARRHPDVQVEVSEVELEQALPELRLGSVDVVISDEYDGHPRPRPGGVEHVLLMREQTRLVLPAAHPLAASGGDVRLAALQEDVWTTSNAQTGHHAMVVGVCRQRGGFDPLVRHHSNDADVQLELVRAAGAVTVLPDLTLPPQDPELAVRQIAGGTLWRRLFAVVRCGGRSPAIEAYLSELAEVAARHDQHARYA